MTKRKTTRSALLMSALSMVLCMAMLVGSTFAWFTDSVTSGKNKIIAGNLDVELYNVKGDEETPVTADTNLFLEDALWEPGHVEVVNLKVANLGTLALKYQFGINVADEKSGINAAGEAFKLSDYIKFALIDGNQNYDNRDAAIAAAEVNAVALSALAVDEKGVLYPADKATDEIPSYRYVTIVAYMPTTVGNEANYKTDTEAPEITLGVTLLATQTPYEEDSFGSDYDVNAPVVSYQVTPENIQEYLDGAHGSMTNARLILAPGDYGKLVIGTPSKYAAGDTVYTCKDGNNHSKTPVVFTDAQEFKVHMSEGWHYTPYYTRTISNLTLVGQEGVTVDGLSISSGHVNGNGSYDPVRDLTVNSSCYFMTLKIDGLKFEGINFTARVNIATSDAETVIDDVTFDNCSFETNVMENGGQGLRYYNENHNGSVKNLTVKKCTFTNCYQGIYTSNIVGISVTDCKFDTTTHNAVAVQPGGNHKSVVISNNSFTNIGDRIIRFGNVGADTQITIQNNIATNSGDSDGQVIKATTLAYGIVYDISGNNWGDSAVVANPELKDRAVYPDEVTDESFTEHEGAIAVDGNGNYFTSFSDALTAGGTIYFKQNAVVDFPTHINVLKNTTIYANGADFSGKDISIGTYAAPETNEVNLTIYNAKNLKVWGEPKNRGNVWNVTMIGCQNKGCGLLMYRGGDATTDVINFVADRCTTNGYTDSIIHTTADGSVTITDCTFSNNCAPINIAHKSAGTMAVSVEDCIFIACGKVDPSNDYFAPVRFVNNASDSMLIISLKNNVFNDTIGTNGDILLGDYRPDKNSYDLTCEIVTEQSVMVKNSKDVPYSCAGGTVGLIK